MITVEALLPLCLEKSLRLATAESCTGGLLAAELTRPAGASQIFERGVVTYSNAAKTDLLGVSPALLAAHGAVSEPVARAMAEGLLARAPVDLSVAITGIAGPGGSDHKPEGRICFALASTRAPTRVQTIEFGPRGRDAVRIAARDHALSLLLEAARAA